MKYLNLKIFKNKDEIKKNTEIEYFDTLYKGEKYYKENMEMLELSLDIEPNLGRNERYYFVQGLTISKLFINRLSNSDYSNIDNDELVGVVVKKLEKEEKNMNLDDYQKEYFRYGVFSGILLISNEKTKEQEKCLKK